MSLLKAKGIQVGNSLTSLDNYVIYQPVSPDGTLRIGNGNSGSSTDVATFDAGDLTITGEFTELSTILVKKNVSQLEGALDSVLHLRGVQYNKDGKASIESGLIAEEVAQVAPELVSFKDGKPYGVKYTKVVVYLIEAIKELQEEIRQLKDGKSS